MKKIIETRKEFKKGYTKRGREKWVLIEETQREINETTYYKMIKGKNPFGREYQKKSYTCIGLTTTYISNTCFNRMNKVIYEYTFE